MGEKMTPQYIQALAEMALAYREVRCKMIKHIMAMYFVSTNTQDVAETMLSYRRYFNKRGVKVKLRWGVPVLRRK